MSDPTLELVNVKAALQTALQTIDGLHVKTAPVGTVVLPACSMLTGGVDFWQSMNGGAGNLTRIEIELTVAVQSAEAELALEQLDRFMSPTGALSIKAAVFADKTLGGTVSVARVISCSEALSLEVDGVEVFGCVFDLEIFGR